MRPSERLSMWTKSCGRVLLTGPVAPDGDSIGACLALAHGLRAFGVTVDVAGTAPFRYTWLEGADQMVPDAQVQPHYDGVMILDGDRHRLTEPVQQAFEAARTRGIVDHHASTQEEGYEFAWVDGHAASTCGMVFSLLDDWNIPLTRTIAEWIYTGVVFDTGSFRHSNTDPDTHRLAARLLETGIDHARINARVLLDRRPVGLRLIAQIFSSAQILDGGRLILSSVSWDRLQGLGAQRADLEGIVEMLLYTEGVELACLVIEGPRGCKLSLRSRKIVDVARLAHAMAPDGGGHPRAAGVFLEGRLEDVMARLPDTLSAALG